MSRLIDADVLIELLTTAIRNMKGMAKFLNAEDDPEIKMEIKAYTDILNGVKEQPTIEPDPKWIPCSEKLPKRGKDVLVTRHYLGEEDNNKSCYYTEVAARYGDDDNPDWISYSDEYKIHPKNHIVIAWQELPEPYKGKE